MGNTARALRQRKRGAGVFRESRRSLNDRSLCCCCCSWCVCVCVCVWERERERERESENHSVVSDSLRPHGLYSPLNSPGQNTGVGSLYLLWGIFPTQGLNPGLHNASRFFTSWAIREVQERSKRFLKKLAADDKLNALKWLHDTSLNSVFLFQIFWICWNTGLFFPIFPFSLFRNVQTFLYKEVHNGIFLGADRKD